MNNQSNAKTATTDTTNKEVMLAAICGLATSLVLFALYAPRDAKYELHQLVVMLNHLI